METSPLISVIIPVFNAEKYLKESIESVLGQTYKNIEVICLNDGSTDNSLQTLKSFKDLITLVDYKENCGSAVRRNEGMKLANGEFIAFLDADDVWEKEKLNLQIEQFKNIPDLDISFSLMQCFLSPELPEKIKKMRYCPPNPMAGQIPGTAVFRKKLLEKTGYFDTKFKNSEFTDWTAKAKEGKLNIITMEKVLLLRRIHETNTTVIDRKNSQNDYLRMVRESIQRKNNKKL